MPVPEIVHELPMRWADLDTLNHVNNVVYLDYAAESRAMLADEGVIEAGPPPARITIDFLRPLLLSRRPVQVWSTVEADQITQEIRPKGSDAVFARVVTSSGNRPELAPYPTDDESLPSRVRRSDLDPTGSVSSTKMFELFQEARVLFISRRLTAMKPGRFVVGRVDVSFGAPMTWRAEPYRAQSRLSRIGGSSVTIETQLLDGSTVLAQCMTVLVGFDLETQKSRTLTDVEKTEFAALRSRC